MIFDRLDFYDDTGPRDGAMNMAIDELLARTATHPTLRVYRWAQPSVSFGYFGRHADVSARWPARELVRRWTGGGEVPHGEDFTYTLAVPRAHPFSAASVHESYRAVHSVLATVLPGAILADAEQGDAAACFAHAVVADVIVEGRKIAGAAQRRGAFGLLHQGSVQGIPVPPDFGSRLAAALSPTVIACSLSTSMLEESARLSASKYATREWLQRR